MKSALKPATNGSTKVSISTLPKSEENTDADKVVVFRNEKSNESQNEGRKPELILTDSESDIECTSDTLKLRAELKKLRTIFGQKNESHVEQRPQTPPPLVEGEHPTEKRMTGLLRLNRLKNKQQN